MSENLIDRYRRWFEYEKDSPRRRWCRLMPLLMTSARLKLFARRYCSYQQLAGALESGNSVLVH
jgi:hypothetical protein